MARNRSRRRGPCWACGTPAPPRTRTEHGQQLCCCYSCEIKYSNRRTVTAEVGTPRSGQLVEQRLRLDEVTRVEALGEPGVDRGQQRAGFGALALALPEAGKARRSTQLEGLRLLCRRDLERAAEECLGRRGARGIAGEQQLALPVVKARVIEMLARLGGHGEPALDRPEGIGVPARRALTARQGRGARRSPTPRRRATG